MVVEFYIFFLEENQIQLQEMGKSIPFEECNIKKVGFVNIGYFAPRSDFPEYTLIGSAGEEFTCNENYEAVKSKIQEACIFKFN